MRLFLLFNTADSLQRIRAALGPERPGPPIAGLLRLSGVPNALREPLARVIDAAGQRRFAFPAHAAVRAEGWPIRGFRHAYRGRLPLTTSSLIADG